MTTVLVTGGIGYIGSHTLLALLKQNFKLIVLDNLINSSINVLERIQSISGQKIIFYQCDIRNSELLAQIFSTHKVDAVIHFAGLKSVFESQIKPIEYYDNNVIGSIVLLNQMLKAKVGKLIFSSSATVYGSPSEPQYTEDLPTKPINIYGKTKLMVEEIINDISYSNPSFRAVCLRYFNPVGAHYSGLIGENPLGIPNNLMPYIGQVALGKLPFLKIYGNDYETPDGTGMRDYIHVDDLASGHLLALKYLDNNSGVLTVNLGNEKPYSVLEVVQTFEAVSGIKIPYKFVDRRSGDLPVYYANAQLARKTIGWIGKHGLKEMCEDSWRFYKNSIKAA